MTEKAINLGNKSASPTIGTHVHSGQLITHDPGLTKREYFAALAMQGMLANSQADGSIEDFAKWSVQYADALLEELCKTDEQPKTENP
jgi:hypothetical protein